MAGDDPQQPPPTSTRRARSTSRSRPTTPLRPSSRSSFRESARSSVQGEAGAFPLNTFEPAFAELADAVADLEANMMHFQLMHESLARFSESFASFLYGLNMNAFCVDFPEVWWPARPLGLGGSRREGSSVCQRDREQLLTLWVRVCAMQGPMTESFRRMKVREEEQQSKWTLRW